MNVRFGIGTDLCSKHGHQLYHIEIRKSGFKTTNQNSTTINWSRVVGKVVTRVNIFSKNI